MDKVVIFGTGGAATMAYFNLTHASSYEVVAFTVDREYINESTLFDLPVVPFDNIESRYPPDTYKMLVAVGYIKVNRVRAKKYYQAKEMGYQLASYVNPTVTTWPGFIIGENCRIGANVIIQPLVEIGNNVVIAANSVIGHHTVIGDHCFLSINVTVAGSVRVKPYSFIGANSTIRNRVTIARESVIGAGSVILEDTEEKGVYMAHPADQLPISSDELSLA